MLDTVALLTTCITRNGGTSYRRTEEEASRAAQAPLALYGGHVSSSGRREVCQPQLELAGRARVLSCGSLSHIHEGIGQESSDYTSSA